MMNDYEVVVSDVPPRYLFILRITRGAECREYLYSKHLQNFSLGSIEWFFFFWSCLDPLT